MGSVFCVLVVVVYWYRCSSACAKKIKEKKRHCRGVIFAQLIWLSRVSGRCGTERGQRVIERIIDDTERPPGIGESLFTFFSHNTCPSLSDEANKLILLDTERA